MELNWIPQSFCWNKSRIEASFALTSWDALDTIAYFGKRKVVKGYFCSHNLLWTKCGIYLQIPSILVEFGLVKFNSGELNSQNWNEYFFSITNTNFGIRNESCKNLWNSFILNWVLSVWFWILLVLFCSSKVGDKLW